MISIIDYDAGNTRSVEKAIKYLGENVIITDDRDKIMSSDRVILPGVGSFGDAMNKLRSAGLDTVIHEFIATGKPFLGICLGLQLLFEDSEESLGVEGLGILKGHIRRIPSEDPVTGEYRKVPHIGWNDIDINPKSSLLKNIGDKPYVYFVHSYYLDATDKADVAATTNYGVAIDAAVERGNVYATQFHPEKSSEVGLGILKNFISM